MASPFYVWALNQGARAAGIYYRVDVPMEQLRTMKYAEVYEDHGTPARVAESELALLHSDIAQFFSMGGAGFLHRLKTIRGVKPGRRGDTIIVPPALIFDADDNTDYVHPFNITYAQHGVRDYPDGHLLRPDDPGLSFMDESGEEYVAWQNKVTQFDGMVFDIERNLREMKIRHEAIRTCHGATVPSAQLASYYRNVIGQKNVYVFPNTVVPEHYEKYNVQRTDDRVRLLWQGSQSHYIDWWPLRDALRTIARKYEDKIKIVVWGEHFGWIDEFLPEHMLEYHPWTPYDMYRLKRGLLNIDINLCPLVNNPFNACKSAIKWYEGQLWDNPEATLAQKTPVYSEIVDNETGLLFENDTEFVQKLSALIENADLRKRLGAEGKKWVFNNRLPQHTIPGLFEFYQDTRAEQKRNAGAPTIKPASLADLKELTRSLR